MLKVQRQRKRSAMVRPNFLVAIAGKNIRDICFKHTVRVGLAGGNAIQRFVNGWIEDGLCQRNDDFAAQKADGLEVFFDASQA